MEIVRQIASWAMSVPVRPLALEAVPGTNDVERRGLAAIGGLAGALAGARAATWPEPLRQWVETVKPPRDLVAAIERERAGGTNVLAAVYERLVSGRSRRRLGTFFTPPSIVEFMLDRAERQIGTPAVVIDPGAGVGAFSIAARRRWPNSRIVAVDVNVVTLGLLAASQDDGIELVLEDFLTWASSDRAPSDEPRLWIGNPPYTRHQELTAELKDGAMSAAGGLIVSRRAGLSSYFLAATLIGRQPNDVICYLLPATWVDTAYGEALRRGLMQSHAGAIEMYGFGPDVDVFPGTRVAAMMLVVGQESGEKRSLMTASAHLTSCGVEIEQAVDRDRRIEGKRLGGWLWPRRQTNDRSRVPLGDIARVRRGVATGANRFFFLTDLERSLVPARAVVAAVLRLRRIVGDTLTAQEHEALGSRGERRWLLTLRHEDLLDDSGVREWLKAARKAGIHLRYLPQHRDPWYAVETVVPPDVLIGPMSKNRMRAVRNEVKAIHSNALYGLYLAGCEDLVEPLTAWLNGDEGQQALRAQARTYGAGLLKLEPSDLGAVLVPEVDELLGMRRLSRATPGFPGRESSLDVRDEEHDETPAKARAW